MSQLTTAQLASKEGRIALAINLYKSGCFTSQREAAITYDVLKSIFQTRLKGIYPQGEKRSVNLKLIDTEELTLVN
jgi:hypothetical protein